MADFFEQLSEKIAGEARQDEGGRDPDGVPDDGVQADGERIKDVAIVERVGNLDGSNRGRRLRGRRQANPRRLTFSIHEM